MDIKTFTSPEPKTAPNENTRWTTCQIDSNTLFELNSSSKQCRLLKIIPGLGSTYSIEIRRDTNIQRNMPCLVYDSEIKSVYVIGGALILGVKSLDSFVEMTHPACFL